ncbi:MAG TPA: DNA internalization-related competence protein ComEC/Rec2 [Steroidobacteraceae bacterium]
MWAIVAGFVAGCGAVVALPEWPAPALVCAGCLVLAGCAAAARSVILLAFVLGVLLCWCEARARLDDRLAPTLEGQSLTVRGTVASVPQGTLQVLRFRFAPERADLPRLLEVSWYDARFRPRAAERLELEVRLRRPRGFANPGGSDNDARMLREAIGASGYVRYASSLGRDRTDVLGHPVLAARGAVADAIRRVLGERPAAGIVAGLSVGLQDALSREQWRQLARTGTSHLMAISGLHIAMVAAIAAWLGSAVQSVRQKHGATGARRDAAVLTGALAAGVYSALAGWSVPTQRTMIMIALAACALRTRRHGGLVDGLALCAALVLLLDPMALLAPGFWLSFGAVAAILFVTTGYLHRPGLLRGYLQTQVAVTLGLVPVLIGSFGQLSLVAAAVNLVAIPLYTLVIVPAVLLATACVLAWPTLGDPLLHGVAWLIDVTWIVIAAPAEWPVATVAVAGLSMMAWALLLIGVLAALAPLPPRGRWAGVLLAGVACCWRPQPLSPGAVRVTVLDVGQGLATVVQTRAHVLVFDAGPSYRSGTDAGQLVVVPYLQHQGIRRVDLLAASHDDDDHKGGAGSILAALDVRRVVAGPSVRALRDAPRPLRPLERCRRGGRWSWEGVDFAWLHPGDLPHERDNDSSCVLQVSAGEHRFLLTGDIEARAEDELLAAGEIGPVEVMIAPHHGSRTSSSAPFVSATQPRWVVFTVGHRNRWGFPSPLVVGRWQDAGAQMLRTSASGAVEFVAQAGQPLPPPRQWRIEHHRFWQDP